MNKLFKRTLTLFVSICIGMVCTMGAFAEETDSDTESKFKIEFIGDSICDGYRWYNTFEGVTIDNNGVGGYTTEDLVDEFDSYYGDYDKMLIICGVNDLGGYDPEETYDESIANYETMFKLAKENMPGIHIYVTGVLPTCKKYVSFIDYKQSDLFNTKLKALVSKYSYVTFIEECWNALLDPETGYANTNYTRDGLHPNKAGYEVLTEILEPYMYEDIDNDSQQLQGKVLYQYKLDNSTVRFVAQVSIDDVNAAESGNYQINLNGENSLNKNVSLVYRSIYANGQLIEADEGKCFIVTEGIVGYTTDDVISASFYLDNYKNGLSREITVK